jgi:hypothetical protein
VLSPDANILSAVTMWVDPSPKAASITGFFKEIFLNSGKKGIY